jgi:hypothetical protein
MESEYSSGLEEASSKWAGHGPQASEAKEYRSEGHPRGANLLAHDLGDMCCGYWTQVIELHAEIIPIYPPNRCSFDFYGRTIV